MPFIKQPFKQHTMKPKFIYAALLICCACVLPSYRTKCPPVSADFVQVVAPVEKTDAFGVNPDGVRAVQQELEVYPLSMLTVDL